MNVELQEKPIELRHVLEKANRRLSYEQKVREDDPIYSLLILNEELLRAHSDAAAHRQEKLLSLYNSSSEKHLETSKEMAQRLVNNAGDYVSDQIKETIQSGLEEIQAAKQKADDDLSESFFATKLGGYGFLMAGCCTAGAAIYNFILTLGWVHR